MTDKEWAISIVRAYEISEAMDTSIDMVRTFRAEVLKEAEENTWNWLIGLSSDNFPMSREKLHSAMLGDQVPCVTKMIDCPTCVESVDIERGCKTCKYRDRHPMMFPCGACYPPDYTKWLPDNCDESVDGAPGAECCGQCRKEDER